MGLKIFILIIFILLKAIFSAADTAITYTSKYKIAKLSKKDKKAKKINFFIEDKIKFLGAIEIGIITIELFASAFVAEAFTNILARNLQVYGMGVELSIIISVVITTICLSYLLLVFGHILPKQIARNYPEKTAYKLINILWIFAKLNYPFEWLVRTTTKVFSSIFGIAQNPKDKLTEREIKLIISEGKDQGVIDKLEKQIALKALDFNDIEVKNIMMKKEQVDFINIDSNSDEVLQNINKNGYTRMPVYKGQPDKKSDIIGVFNIKDLIIEYSKTNKMSININKFLRPAFFVYKDEKISEVFKVMQANGLSIITVIDNNDIVCGIVTMEDILEILVGKMFDEFDKEKN